MWRRMGAFYGVDKCFVNPADKLTCLSALLTSVRHENT